MSRLFQLTGPNGCGKTSALRALGRSPQIASSLFRLSALDNLTLRSVAVGLQAGQNIIFSRSVRSLLTTPLVFAGLAPSEISVKVNNLLRRFNFAYLLDRDYLTLSGGERQFVALFSCLLSQVDLYLLDDPVVMMDAVRTSEILEVIAECMRTDAREGYGIASVRPEYYAALGSSETVRLGYAPNKAACLQEFNQLLLSLSNVNEGALTVCLEKLTVSPYRRRVLIGETSQEWQSGQIVLITGGNGAGKTCLLQTMAGVLRPSSGAVILRNERGGQQATIGENCFYLPQQFTSLLGFNSLSEELGTAISPPWWKDILTFIYDWRVLNPDLRVPETSLGEKHFCNTLAAISALARSSRPAALLLDEPDSGLDELRCHLLATLLRWLAARNYFIAVVSHHPKVYRSADGLAARLSEWAVLDGRLMLCDRGCS